MSADPPVEDEQLRHRYRQLREAVDPRGLLEHPYDSDERSGLVAELEAVRREVSVSEGLPMTERISRLEAVLQDLGVELP